MPTSQEVDIKKEVVRASRPLEVRANSPAVPDSRSSDAGFDFVDVYSEVTIELDACLGV